MELPLIIQYEAKVQDKTKFVETKEILEKM
jgi:hypothetical protein